MDGYFRNSRNFYGSHDCRILLLLAGESEIRVLLFSLATEQAGESLHGSLPHVMEITVEN
jgi:hypothetical protein